jgi:hypothetical protein
MKKLASLIVCWCLYFLGTLHAQDKNALFPMPNAEGKWGYVNAKNKLVIPYQFAGASPFYEERAFVFQGKGENRTYSVIDTKGKILFNTEKIEYNDYNCHFCMMTECRYSEGLCRLQGYKNDTYYCKYIDKAGKVVLNLCEDGVSYVTANHFSDGLAFVVKNNAWSYIDTKGNVVLQGNGNGDVMTTDHDFHNGWAVQGSVLEGSILAYINKRGEKASFLAQYHIADLGDMKEGYALVSTSVIQLERQDIYYAVLQPDHSLKPITIPLAFSSPVAYVSGYSFSEGLALVRCLPVREGGDNRWMYINTEGKPAFEMPDELAHVDTEEYAASGRNFHHGLACWCVTYADNSIKIVYINKKGKIVLESDVVREGGAE